MYKCFYRNAQSEFGISFLEFVFVFVPFLPTLCIIYGFGFPSILFQYLALKKNTATIPAQFTVLIMVTLDSARGIHNTKTLPQLHPLKLTMGLKQGNLLFCVRVCGT